MSPYYQDSAVTIYLGDCIEVLPQLEETFDMLLTDPPYGVAYVTSWRSHFDKLKTPVANDKTLDVVAAAWPLIMDRLSDFSHWYAFASPRKVVEAAAIFEGFKHMLCWDKGDRGTVGDLVCGFGEAWEAIFYGIRGRRPLYGRPRTVIRYDWSATLDPVHPTVKPVELLSKLINWSTVTQETILDPFMGSGTTLRAAKDNHRKAVGIEIEERYCEIAAKRMAQEVLAL